MLTNTDRIPSADLRQATENPMVSAVTGDGSAGGGSSHDGSWNGALAFGTKQFAAAQEDHGDAPPPLPSSMVPPYS